MKKIIMALCIFGIMLSTVTVSFAEEAEDLSKRVKMTNFLYTDISGNPINTLNAGERIYAKAELEKTNEGTGSQKYIFATFVYNDNRLIDVIKDEGEVSVEDTAPTSLNNEILLPNELKNTKVKTLLLEDMVNFTPLYSPADFGSDSCEILELYANDNLLTFDSDAGKYIYMPPLLNMNYPIKFEAVMKNASSTVQINNIIGYKGTATLNLSSHSGVNSDSRDIEILPSGVPDGNGVKFGKKGYVNSGLIATTSFPTTNLFYLSRTTGAFGSCQVGFIEFDLPDVPSDADYTATLILYTYANKEEHKLNFYICTDEEWSTKEYGKNEMPVFDSDNPISDVQAICPQSADGTYVKCEIPLKTEFLEDKQKIVIAVRPEFGTLNGYAYIDLKTSQPFIKYTVTE